MLETLRKHWPEYLIEATCLGLFMLSACSFGVLLEYPFSPLRKAIADPFARRVLMGVAMGLTAICLIYSPWGKQSGAHMNPAVTLTFWRLGKVTGRDALGYVIAQFIGGIIGVLVAMLLLQGALSDPAVKYVVTLPGNPGVTTAFVAEVVISFLLMTMVLNVSNTSSIASYTGLCAGALVALYISFEAPLSGMSMNPARTFGSATVARVWEALWVYFTAPPLGMLAASEVYLRLRGRQQVACAKLHHQNTKRCIFCGKPDTSGAVA
jgi:aquaporin Z